MAACRQFQTSSSQPSARNAVPLFGYLTSVWLYFVALQCLPGTELVLTLTTGMTSAVKRNRDLRLVKAPQELRPFYFLMAWHPRLNSDPPHVWSVKPCDQRPDLLLARNGFSLSPPFCGEIPFGSSSPPDARGSVPVCLLTKSIHSFHMHHKRPPQREFKETLSLFENSFCLIDESLDAIPETLAYFSNVIMIRNKRRGNPDCRKGVGQAVRAKACTGHNLYERSMLQNR